MGRAVGSGHEWRATFEVEAASAADATVQQAALDAWHVEYSHERPHEAIGMGMPAELYQRSTRCYEASEVELKYPLGYYLRRRVVPSGTICLLSIRFDKERREACLRLQRNYLARVVPYKDIWMPIVGLL